MDVIDLKVSGGPVGSIALQGVGVFINGVPLQDLARLVERPHAEAEGNAALAGSYAPLSTDQIDFDPKHFLGTPVATWFEDGDTVLLGCECGEWGCWPLTARITVGEETVRWSDFRNGHRDWNLADLGPFEFERTQYETATEAVRRR